MKRADKKLISKKLAEDNVCYVLITCAVPADDGNMEVEMTYEGDAALASYLIEGAQTFMNEQHKGESKFTSKIHSINC